MGVSAELLDVVVQVAREAGELIRDEFEREGGPRGPAGACPVDTAAEILIRDRLRARYPKWQFFGEETGLSGDPSECYWLVDPHDGTSAFQQGWRGTAVSIALIRRGTPVLGVVFAPCPPVGCEDLITWVEGAPVMRNGSPIDRVWVSELGTYDVVLVSQYGDRRPTANLELVKPARFIGVPSVAYRLALSAVGESEAAVSVVDCADYDFAAAHAIVKGAGGVVLNLEGAEPQYALSAAERVQSGGLLIGGAPGVVGPLVQRRWSEVLSGTPGDDGPFTFPRTDRIQPGGRTLDRAQGIILGQLVGDALGAQVEFESATEISSRYPNGVRTIRDGGPFSTLAGQPTDDSEMALALARSLVVGGGFNLSNVSTAYVDWYRSKPYDIGKTVRMACAAGAQAVEDGRDVVSAMRSAAYIDSQANGALMRIAPLAIAEHHCLDAAVKNAMADGSLTHPNPVCLAANAAYTAALVVGLSGGDPEDMASSAEATVRSYEGANPILERLSLARTEAPELDRTNIGWVLHAFQNAFFELMNASSLEEGLVRTVARGGDTDTNGAIVGALLGAVHGAVNIPSEWRRMVMSCRAGRGSMQGRPMQFWGVDALRLAEALLAVSD